MKPLRIHRISPLIKKKRVWEEAWSRTPWIAESQAVQRKSFYRNCLPTQCTHGGTFNVRSRLTWSPQTYRYSHRLLTSLSNYDTYGIGPGPFHLSTTLGWLSGTVTVSFSPGTIKADKQHFDAIKAQPKYLVTTLLDTTFLFIIFYNFFNVMFIQRVVGHGSPQSSTYRQL